MLLQTLPYWWENWICGRLSNVCLFDVCKWRGHASRSILLIYNCVHITTTSSSSNPNSDSIGKISGWNSCWNYCSGIVGAGVCSVKTFLRWVWYRPWQDPSRVGPDPGVGGEKRAGGADKGVEWWRNTPNLRLSLQIFPGCALTHILGRLRSWWEPPSRLCHTCLLTWGRPLSSLQEAGWQLWELLGFIRTLSQNWDVLPEQLSQIELWC